MGDGEGHTSVCDTREWTDGTAESETLSMRGNSEHGNRETSGVPSSDGGEGRSANAARNTAGTHAPEESDGLIVPQKRANKVAEATAEHVEGSGSAKGNAREDAARRTQSREPVSIGLAGVREVARRGKEVRFTALLHHVDVDCLRPTFSSRLEQVVPIVAVTDLPCGDRSTAAVSARDSKYIGYLSLLIVTVIVPDKN